MTSDASESGGPSVHVGRVVSVTVDEVTEREVIVRLADGRPGVVPRREVADTDGRIPGSGDTLEVALLARDDPKGRVVVSRAWAAKQEAWSRIEEAHTTRRPLRVRVLDEVKGGYLVDLGVRAFLPFSQSGDLTGHGGTRSTSASAADGAAAGASETPDTADAPSEARPTLVGTEIEVIVTETDRDKDRVVVSRRAAARALRREAERHLFDRLSKGDTVTGTVDSITDFGAMVELGGAHGLLHRSELSWGRVDEIGDVVSVGDEVTVQVVSVDARKRRVGLSLRRLTDDPLAQVEVGSVVPGTVSKVLDYGAFVTLDGGAEGLVHISEMTEEFRRPSDVVATGENVSVKVLGIDRKRRRIELSMTQAALAGPAGTPG